MMMKYWTILWLTWDCHELVSDPRPVDPPSDQHQQGVAEEDHKEFSQKFHLVNQNIVKKSIEEFLHTWKVVKSSQERVFVKVVLVASWTAS